MSYAEEGSLARIIGVDVFDVRVARPEPYLGTDGTRDAPTDGYSVRPPWRSLYARRYETVLVRLRSDDGHCGWGEALAPVGPGVVAEIVVALLAPQVLDSDAEAPAVLFHRLRALMRERGHLVGHQADALAAVDIAAWDLAGHVVGAPVVSLLGGAHRTYVPCYVSGLPRSHDEARALLAKEWAERGATMLKLHLGWGVEADLATVDAVRAAAPGMRLAVDGHWAYGRAEAARLGASLVEREAVFFEAPLAPEDVSGHARLVSGLPQLAVAVGEALRNRYEFRTWLEAGALDVAQPDVARTGLTEATVISHLCSSFGVPVAPHHSVGLGPSMAAGVTLAAAIEDLLVLEHQPTTVEASRTYLGDGATPTFEPSGVQLPDGPGLGLMIDGARLNELATATVTVGVVAEDLV